MSSDLSTDSDQPESPAPRSELLSNNVMGWLFLGLAALLVGGQLYTLSQVIAPLTRPPKFSEKLIDNAIKQDWDESSTSFYVSLEYAAAQIRAINCQIAIASVGGFFLIVVGMLLFATGAVRPFTVEATDSAAQSLTLSDIAPGAFTALLGALVMVAGIMRPVNRTEISYDGKRSVLHPPETQNQAYVPTATLPNGITADYDKNNTQTIDADKP